MVLRRSPALPSRDDHCRRKPPLLKRGAPTGSQVTRSKAYRWREPYLDPARETTADEEEDDGKIVYRQRRRKDGRRGRYNPRQANIQLTVAGTRARTTHQDGSQQSGTQETEEDLYSGPNQGYYDNGAPGYYW
ncbi:hypothetical protein FJT64_003387 [Amphibalanus amphitrite]|uniref:Uncharacterized protein n=1 Tax=Amphibalanus amphitrite TaxID=1232801 RepID=A0A6A4W8C0_AMPAM|nr:hypothetical protein FJT64_003387 [Amphibalanus amphitrite]